MRLPKIIITVILILTIHLDKLHAIKFNPPQTCGTLWHSFLIGSYPFIREHDIFDVSSDIVLGSNIHI